MCVYTVVALHNPSSLSTSSFFYLGQTTSPSRDYLLNTEYPCQGDEIFMTPDQIHELRLSNMDHGFLSQLQAYNQLPISGFRGRV